MNRSRRALLALLLAVPAALGVALVVGGLTNLADGRTGRAAALVVLGALLIVASLRMLRGINSRNQGG